MEPGDRISTTNLKLAGKQVSYLTLYKDGRLVAAYPNPNYEKNPKPGKKKEPEFYAFYIDELPTVQVASLMRDIIPQLERINKAEAETETIKTETT